MNIILATRNQGKLQEINKIIPRTSGITFSLLSEFKNIPEIDETGSTFIDNALIKARTVSAITGLPALADDSGLVIDALEGRPGVMSARYGGDGLNDTDRCKLILKELQPINAPRNARFICVMALVFPDGKEFTSEGRVEGVIHNTLSGTEGFGYDPIFYIPQLKKTMAEITLHEKNLISHRSKALAEIINLLKDL